MVINVTLIALWKYIQDKTKQTLQQLVELMKLAIEEITTVWNSHETTKYKPLPLFFLKKSISKNATGTKDMGDFLFKSA